MGAYQYGAPYNLRAIFAACVPVVPLMRKTYANPGFQPADDQGREQNPWRRPKAAKRNKPSVEASGGIADREVRAVVSRILTSQSAAS
jgi:hypothetical protein